MTFKRDTEEFSRVAVRFDRNRYSVQATLANRPISLRIYAERLVAEAKVIAEHPRVFSRDHRSPGKTIYDWRHYLAVVQRKPGGLRNGAPFQHLPPAFKQLQKQLIKHLGGDREMVEVLALVLQHDENTVERAVENALTSGQVSKQHVMNCLNRLLDVPRPELVQTPSALCLVEEPKANPQRYDHLRSKHHVH